MQPVLWAPARACCLLTLVLALTSSATSLDVSSVTSRESSRKLLQGDQCTANSPRQFFVGKFRGNPNVCNRCSGDRVAWCCRADFIATPQTCKLAGSACCSGNEYRYEYREPDGEIDTDTLDDVWCMPRTCQPAFDVNAWPPSLGGGNGNGNGSGSRPGGRPGGNNPNPPVGSPGCTTRNERRDFVGQYRNPRRSNDNARICNACRARGQVAWCCNSIYGDMASTDPRNCVRARNNDRCCTGREFRYQYFDRDDGWDWDTMDDVWCLPATCTAP